MGLVLDPYGGLCQSDLGDSLEQPCFKNQGGPEPKGLQAILLPQDSLEFTGAAVIPAADMIASPLSARHCVKPSHTLLNPRSMPMRMALLLSSCYR